MPQSNTAHRQKLQKRTENYAHNYRQPWDDKAIAELKHYLSLGCSNLEIAEYMGRTYYSIVQARCKLADQ